MPKENLEEINLDIVNGGSVDKKAMVKLLTSILGPVVKEDFETGKYFKILKELYNKLGEDNCIFLCMLTYVENEMGLSKEEIMKQIKG